MILLFRGGLCKLVRVFCFFFKQKIQSDLLRGWKSIPLIELFSRSNQKLWTKRTGRTKEDTWETWLCLQCALGTFRSCKQFLKKPFHWYHKKCLLTKAYCLWTESLELSIPNVDALQTIKHNKILAEKFYLKCHIKNKKKTTQYSFTFSSFKEEGREGASKVGRI